MCRSFIGKDVVVHTINKERKQTTTFKWNEPSKNILLLRPSPTAPPLAIIQYEDLHWIPTILHGIWEHWLHLFPQYKYTSCFSCKINSFLLCFLSPIGMFSRKQLLFFFNVWKEENQEGRLIDGQRRKDLGQIWGAHCVVSDHECTYGWWWMGNEQHTVVFYLHSQTWSQGELLNIILFLYSLLAFWPTSRYLANQTKTGVNWYQYLGIYHNEFIHESIS